MALARLYMKNLNQRVFDLHRSVVGSRIVSIPKHCCESELRWFSAAPTTESAKVLSDNGKSKGREVAVSEGGERSKPSLRKRRGGLWRSGRDLLPFRLNDLFPRKGIEHALLQASENLNKILGNLSPSHRFGRFKEGRDCYKLRLEVPGLRKEDLKITVEGCFLMIQGESKEEAEGSDDDDNDDGWSFRSYGYYNTCLLLPDDAKVEEIKAELKDGILNITIPRSEDKKKEVREVKIQ